MNLTPEEIRPKLKDISLVYLIAGIMANFLTPNAAYFYKAFQDDHLSFGLALDKGMALPYTFPNAGGCKQVCVNSIIPA